MPALNAAALKAVDETQRDQGVGPGGTRTLRTRQLLHSPKYGSDNGCTSSSTSSFVGGPGRPLSSRDNTPDHTQASGFDVLLHEIQELRAIQGQLEERFENLKSYQQQEYTAIVEALQEKQYRCERLEEELSDLTELHQNEILNLKEELTSMEEIIVYQSHVEAADFHEALEVCHTHLFKMEQQQQQQQVVQLEGLENFTAQVLLAELINVLLAVIMILLVFVSTLANCVSLMRTPSRALSTLLFLVLLALLWGRWDAVSDYLHFSILRSTP